jgi:Skp family chaperone for outer membrane proteins
LPSITAEEVVNLFEADARARKRLAELLVSEPDVRLAIINAVLRDVATKDDIETLRAATKSDIEALREEMESFKAATKSDMEALRKELKGDIEALKNATKSDMEALRREVESLRRDVFAQVSELRERVSKLEGAFTQLVGRIGDLDKRIDYVAKVSWTLTISVLAALVAHLILALLRAP